MSAEFTPDQENPMSIADRELRERCLAMAIETRSGDVIALAALFVAYVTGESAKSPREQIVAALDAADVR